MTDAEPVHVESRRPDALTVDQVREIRVQLPAGDVLDVFDMLLATGARIGEVLGILWTDIDLEAEHPTLHFTGKVYGSKRETFTKSKRDDPPMILPTFGIAVLERRERVSELVFPNTVGKPWDPNNFRKQWRAMMKSIGQDDLNTHKLRRTVATRIAQVMDSQTAADQLRHASSDVTERHYIAKLTENVDATQALETFAVSQSGR